VNQKPPSLKVLHRAYVALDNIFTDKEAWFLFRSAAFLETFGWTVLIIGIIFSYNKWAGHDAVLAIAGSIHGIFYIAYLFIVIFGHRSMKWSVWRFVFAELISVVPYGALVFEIWVAHRRRIGKT
jgi:integral membrane protein